MEEKNKILICTFAKELEGMKSFKRYTRFLLVWVFLVIAAGGIVRMTQSGMGCPDWPRCFGYWIPPTNASQLPADFEKYLSKQDIDHTFNVYHTWIEYINRLFGALLGLFIFPYVIWAIRKFWKKDRTISLLAIGFLLFTGLIGFTGKLVVDMNLEVLSVTIHMLLALIVAGFPLTILVRLKNKKNILEGVSILLPLLLLGLVLTQVVLGTQVREEIDVISKSLSYESRELWMERLGDIFKIHRSFSWIVLFVSGFLVWKSKDSTANKSTYIILGFVLLSVLVGVIMKYFNIPAVAQPIHLLLGCGLTMAVYHFIIQTKFVSK